MISNTLLIGVSGASGSGKSTLSEALAEALPSAAVLSADRYFKKDLPRMISPLDGEEYPDWNHPDSIDGEAMRRDLLAMAQSGSYRYLIAEGAFLYCIAPIRALLDYKIWVDASIETRLFRRIARNVVKKGQTIAFIGGYYLAAARYREKEYSLPSARYADRRVLNEAKDEYRLSLPSLTALLTSLSGKKETVDAPSDEKASAI